MSHFTTIQTKIKSVTALASACQQLGVSLQHGVQARGYQGQLTECDYCIRWQNSPYDVAAIGQTDGSYNLKADFYKGYVADKLGYSQGKNEMEKNFGRLLQTYAKYTILEEACKNNMYVSGQETNAEGQIVLRLTTY